MSTEHITRFNYQNNQSFGGYFTYWGLFFKLISQIYTSKLLTKRQKIASFLELILVRSIWYLTIKPLGTIFSYQLDYKGVKTVYSSREVKLNIKGEKTFILYLFNFLPIFYIKKRFNQKDIEYLLNK